MLASPCDNCCFFKDKKCLQDQFFITNEKCSFAPGLCKMYRPQRWAEGKDQQKLTQLMIEDSKFSYDLIVIYDKDNINELNQKLNWTAQHEEGICKRIIVCDIIKNKTDEQKEKIVNWFKEKLKWGIKIQLLLNVVLDYDKKIERIIKDINDKIKENYFAVIPFNVSINRYATLDVSSDRSSRYIYYPFVRHIAKRNDFPHGTGSFIVPYGSVYGLYVNNVYKKLTTNDKTFYENLRDEEVLTGILLSKELDIGI